MISANYFRVTPGEILGATLFIVGFYVMGYGLERFYYEALGTWILSPLIYVKISPAPLDHWLLYAFNDSPLLCRLACAVPIALLAVALFLACHSLRRNSLPAACACFLLVLAVFSVFHSLQRFGLSYVAG
jgi:hypothetical protein